MTMLYAMLFNYLKEKFDYFDGPAKQQHEQRQQPLRLLWHMALSCKCFSKSCQPAWRHGNLEQSAMTNWPRHVFRFLPCVRILSQKPYS